MTEESFSQWAIIELFGHKRLGGLVTEQRIAGSDFVRVDVPGDDGEVSTYFYHPSAVYGIHPTTEDIARAVAVSNQPVPVQRWELPAIGEPALTVRATDERYDDDDGPPF